MIWGKKGRYNSRLKINRALRGEILTHGDGQEAGKITPLPLRVFPEAEGNAQPEGRMAWPPGGP